MFVAASQQSLKFTGAGPSFLSTALLGSLVGRGSDRMDIGFGPIVTQEGEVTDPAFYNRLFVVIASKVGGDNAPLLEASKTPTSKKR